MGDKDSTLVGKKLRAIRLHRGISVEEFSEEVGISVRTVNLAESGLDKYNKKQLDAIRDYLKIKNVPLTEAECMVTKERFKRWHAHIKYGRMKEAKAMLNELANLVHLEPCDPDAATLYKLFEIRIFLSENELFVAEDWVNRLNICLDRMNNECLYFYNIIKGYICLYHKHHKEALKFYLKAWELSENHRDFELYNNDSLCFNLCLCFTYLELPNRAIYFIRNCKIMYIDDLVTDYALRIDALLALNLVKINELKEAARLLEVCHIKAESTNNKILLGRILFAWGLLYIKTESWTTAQEYFNEALEHYKKDADDYYCAYYYKVYCILGTRKFSAARRELKKAQEICGTNDVWEIYFEALDHHITISSLISRLNYKSIDYIKDIAIPHFIKMHDNFLAIKYIKLIREQYRRSRSTINSYQMSEQLANMYELCLINNDLTFNKNDMEEFES